MDISNVQSIRHSEVIIDKAFFLLEKRFFVCSYSVLSISYSEKKSIFIHDVGSEMYII